MRASPLAYRLAGSAATRCCRNCIDGLCCRSFRATGISLACREDDRTIFATRDCAALMHVSTTVQNSTFCILRRPTGVPPVSRHRFTCSWVYFGVSLCARYWIFEAKNAVFTGLRNRMVEVRILPGAMRFRPKHGSRALDLFFLQTRCTPFARKAAFPQIIE
jgi:hypothetical protein